MSLRWHGNCQHKLVRDPLGHRVQFMSVKALPAHLGDGSGDALSLPGDGAAGAGESGRGGPRLERRHGLRDAAGQRELLAELDVRASLGCKARREDRISA